MKDRSFPPKINLFEGVRTADEEKNLMQPMWKPGGQAETVEPVLPQKLNFNRPAAPSEKHKSAIEIVKERKAAQKAKEDAERKAIEEAEKHKYDGTLMSACEHFFASHRAGNVALRG